MYGADIWMVEIGGRAGFAQEPADGCLAIKRTCGKQFDGNLAIQFCVFGQVNLTHPTNTELRKNFVAAEFCSGRKSVFGGHAEESGIDKSWVELPGVSAGSLCCLISTWFAVCC
jgi:hypothetical protein